MRHVLHEFLWLVRRRRLMLAGHALLWFELTGMSWWTTGPQEFTGLFFGLHIVLLTMTGLLALEAGEAAPAAGTNTFWRTRPPRWRAVWLAQALYITVALAGPALICWTVNGILLDQTAAQWRAGLILPAMMLSALLVLMVLRTLAESWSEGLGVLFVCGGLIAAGASLQWQLEEHLLERSEGVMGGGYIFTMDLAWFLVVAFVVPATGLTALWVLRMRGRLSRWIIAAGGFWLLVAPLLFWLAGRDARRVELSLAATVPGERTQAGEHILGLLKVKGVPEDRELTSIRNTLYADWPDLPRPESDHPWPWLYLRENYGQTPWLTRRAGERVRAHFPAGTRWYSHDTNETVIDGFELYDWEWHEPMRAKLGGALLGLLATPARDFAVPLQQGASAARDGTHLRIAEVEPGVRNLRIHLEVRHSFSEFYLGRDYEVFVFVLHLPALPAALLMSNTVGGRFHSLQCSGANIALDVTMPDAELAGGARFTPEVLSGAELWHFAPGEQTPFVAKPEEEGVLLLQTQSTSGSTLQK